MYSLKSICEIFDELLSYDTGDDFWKRCVCEASIHDLETEMCDGEVEQCPEEISLREALKDVILHRLEPYKDIKPSVINANKVNEMLNITLRNIMDDMKIEDLPSMFRGTTFPYGPGCPEITKRHAATADWDTGAK